MRSYGLIVLLLLGYSVQGPADEGVVDSVASPQASEAFRIHLRELLFGPLWVLKGGWSFSLSGRYMPEYRLDPLVNGPWGCGINFGLSVINNSSGSRFLISEIGVFGSYHFTEQLDARFLIGLQAWGGSQGSAMGLGPAFIYRLLEPIELLPSLIAIEGVYGLYEAAFFSRTAHLLSGGITMRIGENLASGN